MRLPLRLSHTISNLALHPMPRPSRGRPSRACVRFQRPLSFSVRCCADAHIIRALPCIWWPVWDSNPHPFGTAFETAAYSHSANGPCLALFLLYTPAQANFRRPPRTRTSHSFHTATTPPTAQPQRRIRTAADRLLKHSWGKNGCVTRRSRIPALNWKDGAVAF